MTVDEYYQFIFENTKGLPETAAKEGLTALDYMRKYGAFLVEESVYEVDKEAVKQADLQDALIDEKSGTITQKGKTLGGMVDGKGMKGFPPRRGQNKSNVPDRHPEKDAGSSSVFPTEA